jgi:hypothetical protein
MHFFNAQPPPPPPPPSLDSLRPMMDAPTDVELSWTPLQLGIWRKRWETMGSFTPNDSVESLVNRGPSCKPTWSLFFLAVFFCVFSLFCCVFVLCVFSLSCCCFQICSRNSVHRLVFTLAFTHCRELMSHYHTCHTCYRTGVRLVHTASVFILVFCPCSVFVLWSLVLSFVYTTLEISVT